jgi:hypothetical protein
MLRKLLASGIHKRLIAQKMKRSIGAIESRIFLFKKPRKPSAPKAWFAKPSRAAVVRLQLAINSTIQHDSRQPTETTMGNDEKRSGEGRRTTKERRSGIDTRSENDKHLIGERRSGADRRSNTDRRAEPGDKPQTLIPIKWSTEPPANKENSRQKTATSPLADAAVEGWRRRENDMRSFVASLITLAVLFFWDKDYNNGRILDGLDRMRLSISHSFIR